LTKKTGPFIEDQGAQDRIGLLHLTTGSGEARKMYKVTNILEKIVTEKVDSILPTLVGFCACEQCRADIICLTLNRLPPRYVVHRYSEILSWGEFETLQKKTEIVSTIVRSARQVAGNPHQDISTLDRVTKKSS